MKLSILLLLLVLIAAGFAGAPVSGELEKARDAQDRATLERIANELNAAADKLPADANAQYRAAVADSYLSEVAIELHDKNLAKGAAENGIKAAQKAVALKADSAEYHRMLGTLCGQVIPANALAGALKYGKCALDEVNKAIQMNPKFAEGYLSHGVGNYYLPSQFGGGVELAVKDFQKAIELRPTLAEAHLWLGVALRKLNRNAESRKAFEQAITLNPNRVWAKQQLEKTPAQ
jgi:tetratricopeptide (TPR) repeat protein